MTNFSMFDDSYSAEDAAAERADLDAARSGLFWKPPVGTSIIRVMPPLRGVKSPYTFSHQHIGKVPWLDKAINHNCPRVMSKQPCLTCLIASKLMASKDKTAQKLGKDIAASARVTAVIIVRGVDSNGELTGKDLGPKLYGFSDNMHEKLDAIFHDKRGGGRFFDPAKGFDLVIEREGTGQDTRYKDPRPVRELSPLGTPEQVAEWVENYPDLSRLTNVPTTEEVIEMLGNVPRSLMEGINLRAMTQPRAQLPAAPAAAPRAAAPQPAARPAAPAASKAHTIQDDTTDDSYDPDVDAQPPQGAGDDIPF